MFGARDDDMVRVEREGKERCKRKERNIFVINVMVCDFVLAFVTIMGQ